MDFLVEFLIELFSELLETVFFDNIKSPNKRKCTLTVFYAAIWLAVTALPAYLAVTFGMAHNTTGAAVLGVLAGAMLLAGGYLIIRGHRQNWRRR